MVAGSGDALVDLLRAGADLEGVATGLITGSAGAVCSSLEALFGLKWTGAGVGLSSSEEWTTTGATLGLMTNFLVPSLDLISLWIAIFFLSSSSSWI